MSPTPLPPRPPLWRSHGRAVLAAAVLVAAAAGTLHAVMAQQREQQQARNELLQGRIVQVDAQIKELMQLRSQIEDLLQQRQAQAQWQAQREWPARLLRLLAQARPANVRLERVQETDFGLRINGRARDFGDIEPLMQALNSAGPLRRVDVVNIEREADRRTVRFALDARVDAAWRPMDRAQPNALVGGTSGDPD